MMFRSIRVSLVFWFAVILLGLMAVLGVVLHRELRATLYREADSQLAHWMESVQGALSTSATAEAIARDLRAVLPQSAKFVVFAEEGQRIASSVPMPELAVPTESGTVIYDHHRWQSVARASDAGWIVVGRSVRDENHSIRRFLVTLLAAGTGIVLLTCVGGYLVASRALAPTKAIAASAQRIAADNLQERIDVCRVPTELRPMAVTLNESFARIEAAFAAQVAFTADASHELRTPLAVVVAHLELAAGNTSDVADVARRIAICQDAAKRIEAIVTGLLMLARADAGEAAQERGLVDLAALAQQHVQAMQPLAAARGITLDGASAEACVHGNYEQLAEVISNLIDNAIRYNREGGTVTVAVACEDDCAALRVSDSGMGLAADQLPRVFDRFYRADASRSRQDGATGLGLSITQCIVHQHGGSIAAYSSVGEGSEFVVRLPLVGRE